MYREGKVFRHRLAARVARGKSGRIEVRAPVVGLLRPRVTTGSTVDVGDSIGVIEVLGVLHEVTVDAQGVVVSLPQTDRNLARIPVEFDEILLVLDPNVSSVARNESSPEVRDTGSGLLFRAPSTGRVYRRPAPDKPCFVEVGDTVEEGTTVVLLEVMKTFHRISYGGPGLPERARIKAVLIEDGVDLEQGQALLELEEAD